MASRARLVAMLVPVALAAAFLLPHLRDVGFLSDDFVLTNLLDADGARASWHEIGAQFGERWLYSQAYWRPVVNVVYGVNVDVASFTPRSLAGLNVLLHLGVVAATAWMCLRARGVRSPALGAVVGGAFCALHPAVVETVLWISARVSGLEVFLRMLALCAFQAHLLRPSRGRYAAVVVFAALALGSKESAVVLPAAFVCLDLLDDPRRGLRERVRLHAPLIVLWGAYAAVRVAVLGGFVGSPMPEPTIAQLGGIVGTKLMRLFAPAGAWSLLAWVGVVACAIAASTGRARARLGTFVILGGWIAVCLAPTYKTPLGQGWIGSRMLYDALPVIGIMVAQAVGGRSGARARVLGGVVGVALLASLLPGAIGYARRFEDAWTVMRSARAELAVAGRGATGERPLGILSMPPCPDVPGPMNPVSYFVLGQRPFVDAPFPAVGLGCVLDRFPYSAGLFQDPRPVRALLDLGAAVVRWDAGAGQMVAWQRDGTFALEPAAADGGVLEFAAPRSPFAVATIGVETEADARGGAVTWRTTLGEFGGAAGIAFEGGVVDGDVRRFEVDATRCAPLLALAMAGGRVVGVEVRTVGGAVRGVRVAERPPWLELTALLEGRTIPFADLDGALVAPQGDPSIPMTLVLAGEATGFAVAVTPGAPVALPEDVRFHVRMFANALRASRFWYWFETEPPQGSPGTARSAIDRFAVDVPR